ncbi:MAG: hypothetical protein ACI4Q0_00850 [Oligosphaeraceae bacterium]
MAIIQFALPIPSFPSRTPSAAEGEKIGEKFFPPGWEGAKARDGLSFRPWDRWMLPGNGEKREKTVRGIRNILHVHGRNLRFRRGARVPFPCENEDESPTQNLAGKRINMAAGIFTILRHSEQRFELKNSEFYCEINF